MDCGTARCIYACENCPFGIPEQMKMIRQELNVKKIKVNIE